MIPLQNTAFTFENTYTALHLLLENGTLYCTAAENKITGFRFENPAVKTPILTIPGFTFDGAETETEITTDDRDGLSAPARVQRIFFTKGDQQVKLEMRTYDNNPFIHLSVSLQGTFGVDSEVRNDIIADGIEIYYSSDSLIDGQDVMFGCPISGQHYRRLQD